MLGGCWALVSSEKKRKLLKILDHFALGPIQHTHHWFWLFLTWAVDVIPSQTLNICLSTNWAAIESSGFWIRALASSSSFSSAIAGHPTFSTDPILEWSESLSWGRRRRGFPRRCGVTTAIVNSTTRRSWCSIRKRSTSSATSAIRSSQPPAAWPSMSSRSTRNPSPSITLFSSLLFFLV